MNLNQAFILMGSNLGDRDFYLGQAKLLISQSIGEIVDISAIYETEPWGFASCDKFLNQVIKIQTLLTPFGLLKELHVIEKQMGRIRRIKQGYSSRPLDLDILMYNDRIIHHSELQIPHPKMLARKFTLVPLAEIAGDVIHPLQKLSIRQLAEICEDTSRVEVHLPIRIENPAG